jgi:uncharacterized membrane protein YhaH (DUF805 family)
MDLVSSFVIGQARIARGTWLFRLVIMAIICTAFGMLAQALMGEVGATVFAVAFLWCAGAISVQRLHDSGRSGWNLLFLIIPVLGPLWVLMQLLQRGAEGDNRYGRDPMARLDYLNVDITQ